MRLRKLQPADAPAIQSIRSDERVNRYLDRTGPVTLEEATAFITKIEKCNRDHQWLYWGITIKEKEAVIGTICLWNFDSAKAQAEIGFELHPDFQGRGIMQEAVDRVLRFGFEYLQLSVITALTEPGNQGAIRILENNKFRPMKNLNG